MFKMYIVSICGLEDQALQTVAMSQLDKYRQECVHKYKQEKDRMRAVAAGLLLQAGFLELEFEDGYDIEEPAVACRCRQDMLLRQGSIYQLKAAELTERLLKMEKPVLPLPLVYQTGPQGKPFWDKAVLEALKPDKQLWHFNLSHSGDYVVLVISDEAVGVDIQQARETKRFAGGYEAFSRMEAYVKCTGEGYAKGIGIYRDLKGDVPGYVIRGFELIEGYALYLCMKRPASKKQEIVRKR